TLLKQRVRSVVLTPEKHLIVTFTNNRRNSPTIKVEIRTEGTHCGIYQKRPPGWSDFSRLGVMGLYENWVLPRLLDLAMRNHLLGAYRRRAIKSANGLVLEIGVGSGLNLSLYGPGSGWLCTRRRKRPIAPYWRLNH